MTAMKTNALALTLAGALVAGATPVAAAQLNHCLFAPRRWPGPSARFAGNESLLSSADVAAIREAMELWSSSTQFDFDYQRDPDQAAAPYNLENEISYAAPGSMDPNTPATTFSQFEPVFTCYLTETDIYLNPDAPLLATHSSSDVKAYGGTAFALVPVVLHELGHAMGLAHEADVISVMGSPFFANVNDDTLTDLVGADGAYGAALLYGHQYGRLDVAALHWRYSGSSQGYSTVAFTEVQPRTSASGGLMSRIRPGGTVNVQFSYENISPHPLVGFVRFFWSSDDHIDPGDTALTVPVSLPMQPYGQVTLRHLVPLPLTVPPGKGALGVVTTVSGDAVPENDATFLEVTVLENGAHDWCSPDHLCGLGEGACDSNSECTSGTVCEPGGGRQVGLGDLPVCMRRCTGQCGAGEGHCHHPSDCLPGLICVANVGAKYGLPSGVDVCEVPVVDFAIKSLTYTPGQPTDLTGVTLTAMVENRGNVNLPASKLRLERVGETGATLLDLPPLSIGATAMKSRTFAAFAPGSHTLRATADAAGAVAETNETNNAMSATVLVAVTAPDLVVSLTKMPTLVASGQQVSCRATVRNVGNVTAAASRVRITGGGATLKVPPGALFQVPSLSAGQSFQAGPFTFGTNATAEAEYECTANADFDGAVAESLEGNNGSTLRFQTYLQ